MSIMLYLMHSISSYLSICISLSARTNWVSNAHSRISLSLLVVNHHQSLAQDQVDHPHTHRKEPSCFSGKRGSVRGWIALFVNTVLLFRNFLVLPPCEFLLVFSILCVPFMALSMLGEIEMGHIALLLGPQWIQSG